MTEVSTNRRLDGIDSRIDEVDRRMVARFDLVDERFKHVDERINDVDARIGRFERTIDNRLKSLEDGFAAYQRAVLQMSALIVAALIGVIATQL